MYAILVLLGIAAAVHGIRRYCTNRTWPAPPTETFDGEMYTVDQTTIAVRRSGGPAEQTVVCMPGFLEDMRYFLDLYRDRRCELILVSNANYQCPFDAEQAQPLDWPANPHPPGTIAHDGFIVAQAIDRLATKKDVVLHGHSRGGAVVLEAGRQRGSNTDDSTTVAALLEAPVLPQGKPAGPDRGPIGEAITIYLMPIFLSAMRNISDKRLAELPMMRPTTPRKTELAKDLFSSPKTYATAITNVRDINAWQRGEGHDLYEGYRHITVLVGERDDVLDNKTMIASAEAGRSRNSGVRIVQTSDTNHFITLERLEITTEALDLI